MKTMDGMAVADQTIAKTYNRFPIVIEKGRGTSLWDETGKSYVDFVAGIAVCALGHSHPDIVRAVSDQAKRLFHVSNLYYTRPQTELARLLTEKSFAHRVFFCNSGAEANEAAIKLARRYFSEKKEPGRRKIISMKRSFHGRTFGALSATGQDKIKAGFDPLLGGFDFVPFNDPGALKEKMDSSVCAVMLEPAQGEGGVIIPDPGYLKEVRALCDQHGALLIFDEIQTGMGRTGRLFAYEHFGVEPDIMTLAKALANGLPMGAMLAAEGVAEAFGPGSHASTFGGNPIVAAAAAETLKVIERDDILKKCRETGAWFLDALLRLKEKHSRILDVRGMGLFLGAELDMDGAGIVLACMEKGFLINCVQGNILRFVPPLVIEKKEIDALVDGLDDIFTKAL